MQYKPMTRGKLAKFLFTNTKKLNRYIMSEGIEVPPRTLLTPKIIAEIIKRFNGEDNVSQDVP